MVLPKKEKLVKYLTFLFLALFPLGQLVRLKLPFLAGRIRIHPIEVVSLVSLILLFNKERIGRYPKTILNLILFGTLSLAFSFTIFTPQEIVVGGIYLLRLFSFLGIYLLFKNYKGGEEKIIKLFLATLFLTGIFGWIQYFWFWDLRFTKIFGWDDHLFRLTGSFLDPGYMGILTAFGGIISLRGFLKTKKRYMLLLLMFFVLTTLFTYSRASILSLAIGLSFLLFTYKKAKEVLAGLVLFVFLIFLLPRSGGVGVELERTFSIFARLTNYSETLSIYQKSPVFGVGFNNLCIAREKFLPGKDLPINSCFGSDSSLLVVLSTMGAIGFMVFIHSVFLDSKKISKKGRVLIFSLGISLFVHSFFVNSLFYPWVYGSFLGLTSKFYKE